ncbi:MAG: hypothetical protein K2L51_06720 [Clostridiales bacterium]|nr:hypothetical protein [Clostridiales bacterium]
MVIFLNLDGSCQKLTPQNVYQGSNNVTDITVVAPFPSTTALQIGFILPSGLYWQTSDGARYVPMEYVEQSVNNNVSVWHYNLRRSVTEQMGDLYIAINAVTAQGNTTSYLCKQFVEESVLPSVPTNPEPGVYELITLYLQRLDARTANVPNLVATIQKVADNAFTYTNNSGVESAPIVIEGGADAPIPVNTASVISIPESAWQPVYAADQTTVTGYTYIVTAGLHGQMRDGATANDLWVSFDEAEGAGYLGAFERYTVDTAGNITVYVNQPVTMTVRVWNGKSIADTQARELVVQETQRAESAEQNLQTQISELQNTGVDTEARAEIAALTTRVEAIEDNAAAFTADGWNTVNSYLGALSKAITVPAGKRIVQVLDDNNMPRGTWQGNVIYANDAFAGVAIII